MPPEVEAVRSIAAALPYLHAQWAEDAADAIEARASSAGRIIRNLGQQPLCSVPDHDDRWCSDCDRMEMGMDIAAQMLRESAARLREGAS